MTVVFLFVDIALMFNQYVNPVALTNIGWKYYIFYVSISCCHRTHTYLKQCAWLAIELAIVWKYYIETKNTPLEEIAKHFDGEDALVGGAVATARATELGHGSELKQRTMRTDTENADKALERDKKQGSI
jgi:hypothetical protein